MSEAAVWDKLTRLEQRALIKLFGGGSLRNNDPEVIGRLRAGGLVDENDALAMPGLFVLTLAMRRHQDRTIADGPPFVMIKNERSAPGASIWSKTMVG
jgi:hypothetical protein